MDICPEKKQKMDLKQEDRNQRDCTHPFSFFSPFLTFSYAYKSIYTDGEKTHIEAKESRYANGRFESEEFEGSLDQSVYHQMARQMHRYWAEQLDLFLRPFSSFQPGMGKDQKK